jgi:hypothetical protein
MNRTICEFRESIDGSANGNCTVEHQVISGRGDLITRPPCKVSPMVCLRSCKTRKPIAGENDAAIETKYAVTVGGLPFAAEKSPARPKMTAEQIEARRKLALEAMAKYWAGKWDEFHVMTMVIRLHDAVVITRLKEWIKTLACGGCGAAFDKEIAATPPDVSSREALERWGVDRHNAERRRLGKNEMTFGQWQATERPRLLAGIPALAR